MTRGLGYFYLGERVKGLVVFFVLGFAQVALPVMLGGGPTLTTVVSLVAILLSVAMTIDAYRIGRRSFNAQVAGLDLVADANPSHLPAAVPLAVGGAIAALFALILLAGMVATALAGGQPQ
jgi:hypothetical protein